MSTAWYRTATEIIKHNEATVTLFYGSDSKTCKLMIMAGVTQCKRALTAGNIVKEAAPILGGGGGGRPICAGRRNKTRKTGRSSEGG